MTRVPASSLLLAMVLFLVLLFGCIFVLMSLILDQVDLLVPGETIEILNGKIEMYKGATHLLLPMPKSETSSPRGSVIPHCVLVNRMDAARGGSLG